MLGFGAHLMGAGRSRTLVLTVYELVPRLEALARSGEFEHVRRQKHALATSLLDSRERLWHKRVEVAVPHRQRSQGPVAWPATLRLARSGSLEIDSTGRRT